MKKSNWAPDARNASARYFKAFSNPNLEESFLDGWRLLELIAGPKTDHYDQLILRASNVFKDEIGNRIIGKHLKNQRNLISHGEPSKSDEQEELAFQMLNFIIPMIELYFVNGLGFRSTQELWNFLDLPNDQKDRDALEHNVDRTKRLLQLAKAFRGEISN